MGLCIVGNCWGSNLVQDVFTESQTSDDFDPKNNSFVLHEFSVRVTFGPSRGGGGGGGLQGVHVLHKGGNRAPRAGRCPPRGWQQCPGRHQGPVRHMCTLIRETASSSELTLIKKQVVEKAWSVPHLSRSPPHPSRSAPAARASRPESFPPMH